MKKRGCSFYMAKYSIEFKEKVVNQEVMKRKISILPREVSWTIKWSQKIYHEKSAEVIVG